MPQDGEGYAGLLTLSVSVLSPNYREIIGVELTQPLVSGNTYLVEFYVSNMSQPEIAIATNKIGFNFSTHQYYNSEAFPINTSHYAVEEIIPLSHEWTLISHYFTADSAYNYLHIGSFYDDENTLVDLSSDNPQRAYYAVDNVSVYSTLSNNDQDLSKDNFVAFPNPSSEILTIELKNPDEIKAIRFYDTTGQLVHVYGNSGYSSQTDLDVSHLLRGVYMIQIETRKTVYYEKIIKL
jgi:hypothetical protein